MNVFSNLFNSEKFVFCFGLILAAAVLMVLGKIAPDQWLTFAEVVGGLYVGGKTIQGAAEVLSTKNKDAELSASVAGLFTAATDSMNKSAVPTAPAAPAATPDETAAAVPAAAESSKKKSGKKPAEPQD
jgi:hypothetical protein